MFVVRLFRHLRIDIDDFVFVGTGSQSVVAHISDLRVIVDGETGFIDLRPISINQL